MSVLVFGSVNIDRTFHIPHTPVCGETLRSASLSLSAGGKGANQAVALKKAGTEVFLAATIGKDGVWVKDTLSDMAVDTSLMRVKENSSTGTAAILLDDRGENSIIIYGGGNQENDEEYISSVISRFREGDWIVLQNETSGLEFIIRKAREAKMKICLNPSPMDDEIRKLDLSGVTLLAVNEVEALQMTRMESSGSIEEYGRVIREISSRYRNMMILLTAGEKGALFLKDHDSDMIYQKAFKSGTVVDTTGAGDTFLGYFLSSLIEGESEEKALETAAKAAAVAVSRKGAIPSIPERNEVK